MANPAISGSERRLLIVNWRDPRNPEAGGAEVHLHEVARRLCGSGWQCVQYSHFFPGAPRHEILDGVHVHRVGGKFFFNFTVWFRVRSWIMRHRPDAVLDDSNKVPFFLPLLTSLPVVAQIHHLFGKVLFKETSPPLALYILGLETLMPFIYRNTPVLTGSESSRRELLRKGFRRVAIAPEGADLSHYRPMAGVAKIPGRLVYVGRIKRYKKLDAVLEAMLILALRFPHVSLHVAGSGDDLPRLRDRVQRHEGLRNRVRFLGFVDETVKVRLYSEAEVVVNSSLKEGWGLTSIEANACGTPVVATDVPGLCDSVVDEKTGFLVPFGDGEAFAHAIGRILGDSALAARMREEGLAWAARHTWEGAYVATRDALLKAMVEKA